MIEINFNKVCKNFGFGNILNGVSFEIKTGEIVALIGNNGAGKSTILNIINKEENITSGNITLRNGSKIGYLKQIVDNNNDKRVIDVLNESIKDILDMEERLFELEMKMENASVEEINKLVIKYTNLQNKFILNDGYTASKRLGKVIKGFKLGNHLDTLYNNLSGGEKRIVSLAALILENPDIILLDEPTNHLDIETLEWFEEYLKSIKKTVLIVSHDRYFLDKVVNKIIFLEKGECEIYNGNYTYFEEEHEKRIMNEFEAYKTQEKKIEAMKESIKRLKEYGRRASPEGGMFFRRAASIQKRLDKMILLTKKEDTKELNIKFNIEKRSGNDVLTIKNKDLYINDRLLIKGIKMNIFYQDKVALIGKNGTGKSTLIKNIINLYENNIDDKQIILGTNIKIGYIPQEIKFDDPNKTVYEYTRNFYLGEDAKLRSGLFNFHFFDDDISKKVGTLSGGEKVRLKLFELINKNSNFLIFDEPTNHIDIETRTILEEALKQYKGTLLCISHDRYFINKLINKIYYIDDCKMNLSIGNYDDYKRIMLK